MKYFVVSGRQVVPIGDLPADLVAGHQEFLEKGYGEGMFLLSGPRGAGDGGILVARATSLEAITASLADEPFVKAKVMHIESITEFVPLQYAPILRPWLESDEHSIQTPVA